MFAGKYDKGCLFCGSAVLTLRTRANFFFDIFYFIVFYISFFVQVNMTKAAMRIRRVEFEDESQENDLTSLRPLHPIMISRRFNRVRDDLKRTLVPPRNDPEMLRRFRRGPSLFLPPSFSPSPSPFPSPSPSPSATTRCPRSCPRANSQESLDHKP